MAALSGRMRARIPLDRCPANPRSLRGSGRRDAALLWSAGAFPARRDEALRGALGIGGDGRGGVEFSWSGGMGLLPGPRSLSRAVPLTPFVAARRSQMIYFVAIAMALSLVSSADDRVIALEAMVKTMQEQIGTLTAALDTSGKHAPPDAKPLSDGSSSGVVPRMATTLL